MIDFSPNYLDKIANRLETMSGDPRELGEKADDRILSALETMGNITNPANGYQQRVCDALNNINVGGGGGNAVLGPVTLNSNGIYNASDFQVDGFNKVTVEVPSSGGGGDFSFTITQNGAPVSNMFIGAISYATLSNEYPAMANIPATPNIPITVGNQVLGILGPIVLDGFDGSISNYDHSINIPNSVTYVNMLVYTQGNFNQPITFEGNSHLNIGCIMLDESDAIDDPDAIDEPDEYRFMGTITGSAFNSPVNFGDRVVTSMYDLIDSPVFNQPISVNMEPGIDILSTGGGERRVYHDVLFKPFCFQANEFNSSIDVNLNVSNVNWDDIMGGWVIGTPINVLMTLGAQNIASFNGNFNLNVNYGDLSNPATSNKLAINMANIFRNCYSFNQNLTIPAGVSSCNGLLSNCYAFGTTVSVYTDTLLHKISRDEYDVCTVNMLAGCNSELTKIVKVYNCPNSMTALLTNYAEASVTGTDINWNISSGYVDPDTNEVWDYVATDDEHSIQLIYNGAVNQYWPEA